MSEVKKLIKQVLEITRKSKGSADDRSQTGENVSAVLKPASLYEKRQALTTVGWKAWYYINKEVVVYQSCKHKWEEIPAVGIQILRKYFTTPEGRIVGEIRSGHDAYIYNDKIWTPENAHLTVKLGTFLPDDVYDEIRKEAGQDTKACTKII